MNRVRMDSSAESLLEYLRRQIAERQVLLVVGAGVSMAATAGSPTQSYASWKGLLDNGISSCLVSGTQSLPAGWAERRREDLASNDLDRLLSVAKQVASQLGAPRGAPYASWLSKTVGVLKATTPAILYALSDLSLPIATTNYDDLLEEVTGLPAVTWRSGAQVEHVVRGHAPGILHLHGHWQDPESVVLSPGDYRAIQADQHTQAMMRALRATKTLVFIGFGAGLEDPNFAAFRHWTAEAFSESPYPSLRLCLDTEWQELRALHPPTEKLSPLVYGKKHDDLVPFLRSLDPAKLPQPPAHCFGRDDAVADLLTTVLSDSPRPTPLLGPPGVGKTTVSLMILYTQAVVERFGLRRYFVRCDGAWSGNTLVAVCAAAVGLKPSTDPEQQLLREFQRAPALLVLDNLETSWEADPEPVESLLGQLAALPALALVASLRGTERPGRTPWREAIRLDPLPLEPARQAFLAIAGKKHQTDPLLDQLLRAVDGLPLAVNLLAHEAEGLPSLDELWQRWESIALERLGGHTRETSLYKSVLVSLDSKRMTETARRLASLLALLPDGAAPEDRQALLPREDTAVAAATLRKTALASLDAPRLRLLAPIRQVLRRHRPPQPDDRERLVAHFIALADLGHKLGEEGGAEALKRLTPEAGNLAAILSLALDDADPRPAIKAMLAFAEFQHFTHFGDRNLVQRALEGAKRVGAVRVEAQFNLMLGDIARLRSDYEIAPSHYKDALSLFRLSGFTDGEANCIQRFGDIAYYRSEFDTARSLYGEALALHRRVGSVRGEAGCTRGFGDIALQLGKYKKAWSLYENALSLNRRAGSLFGEANCLVGLGNLALKRRDHATARSCYKVALELYRRGGTIAAEADCLRRLGDLDIEDSISSYFRGKESLERLRGRY
jgi:tetratricopeptide (TPR) repeat protein